LTSTLSDIELIVNYKTSGDKQLVGELFKRYTNFVFSVCMKYLKNSYDSEDATMQIFEKIFTDLQRFEVANFKSWLHVIAKNYCMMKLRKPNREIYTDNFVEKDFDLHHEAANEKEQQLLALEKAIAELPADQRNCVELFYINQKSYKEITQQTGYDYNKVKSYIQNGKRNLQLKLQHIVVTIILILFYIFK
jgi:RNA polymerase sigma-70 factor (ECF subfamily)